MSQAESLTSVLLVVISCVGKQEVVEWFLRDKPCALLTHGGRQADGGGCGCSPPELDTHPGAMSECQVSGAGGGVGFRLVTVHGG